MSFNEHFGLTCNPFSKEIRTPEFVFESTGHKLMLDRLNYNASVRGIGVFTAPPGVGKSYTLHVFKRSLNPSLFTTKYITLSTVSVADFYKQLCEKLSIDAKGGKPSMFRNIQYFIYHLYKDKGQTLVLIIDEAQYLSSSVLKDLKLLMNFVYDSLNCFALILSGESYLNSVLARPVHEALRQRIVVHYDYKGLEPDEIPAYIYHKINAAGGAPSIIDEAAVSAITGFSNGVPRIIDKAMTNALTLAAQTGRIAIDADIMAAAISELSLS